VPNIPANACLVQNSREILFEWFETHICTQDGFIVTRIGLDSRCERSALNKH
jgi:hypothetical protein